MKASQTFVRQSGTQQHTESLLMRRYRLLQKGPRFFKLGTATDLETGLSYCFSKCGHGWDMTDLYRDFPGGDFTTARQRVFAGVGRQWDEPSATELARLAEQRQQDPPDELLAICWYRRLLHRLVDHLFTEPVTPQAGNRQ